MPMISAWFTDDLGSLHLAAKGRRQRLTGRELELSENTVADVAERGRSESADSRLA